MNSEFVRRVTENWLERYPEWCEKGKLEVPVIHAGKCLLPADRMREAIYE